MPKIQRYGAKNLECRADFFVRVNGVSTSFSVPVSFLEGTPKMHQFIMLLCFTLDLVFWHVN